MSLRLTGPSPRPASPFRPGSAASAQERTTAPALPRTKLPRHTSSGFETSALPRALLEGARTRSVLPTASRPTSNEFVSRVSGRHPPVAVGGFLTQLKQSAATAHLALSAAASVASGGRLPPDFIVGAKLRALSVTPLTRDANTVTRSDYFSRIAGVKPEQAYEYFVNNPNAVFGATDLKIRPETARLQDGARLMLEQPGSPSVWFPIEVRLDPARRQINIQTLDGHPLRGTNQFTFADDGQGGTRVNQLSSYQLSSVAVELAMGADDLARQSSGWKQVHAHLFEHFYPRS